MGSSSRHNTQSPLRRVTFKRRDAANIRSRSRGALKRRGALRKAKAKRSRQEPTCVSSASPERYLPQRSPSASIGSPDCFFKFLSQGSPRTASPSASPQRPRGRAVRRPVPAAMPVRKQASVKSGPQRRAARRAPSIPSPLPGPLRKSRQSSKLTAAYDELEGLDEAADDAAQAPSKRLVAKLLAVASPQARKQATRKRLLAAASPQIRKQIPKRRLFEVASPQVRQQAPKKRLFEAASPQVRKEASQKKCLAVASPQVNRLIRRTERRQEQGEDWSRELRAWSPERREDQAKRRAIAEELVKAKEEQQQEEHMDERPEPAQLSTDAACVVGTEAVRRIIKIIRPVLQSTKEVFPLAANGPTEHADACDDGAPGPVENAVDENLPEDVQRKQDKVDVATVSETFVDEDLLLELQLEVDAVAAFDDSLDDTSSSDVEQPLAENPCSEEIPGDSLGDVCLTDIDETLPVNPCAVEVPNHMCLNDFDDTLSVNPCADEVPVNSLDDLCLSDVELTLPVNPCTEEVPGDSLEDLCLSDIEQTLPLNPCTEEVPCESLDDFRLSDIEQTLPVNPCTEEVPGDSLEDMCLSDVEELLGDEDDAMSPSGLPEPQDEVESLLEELAATATTFDSKDYWVDGAWDIEGLREDAEQQRQERWAHEESLWRIEQASSTSPGATSQLVRSPSPDPEYPLFAAMQPRRLAFSLSQSFNTVGRFAKQSLRPDSDATLGQKLRQFLSR